MGPGEADTGQDTVDEAQRLREENQRLREGLEGVLTILGNPAGYCENDRVEVEQAIAEVERALGRRPEPQWRRLHPPQAPPPEHAQSRRAK
jgi:hypothetical protein